MELAVDSGNKQFKRRTSFSEVAYDRNEKQVYGRQQRPDRLVD